MVDRNPPAEGDVAAFLAAVEDERRRVDSRAAVALAREVSGAEPRMWGSAIVGFGAYHYRYPTGREGDAPRIGLSPRKAALTLYGLQDDDGAAPLLERLGAHTLGKGCVYVKELAKVDLDVLRQLMVLAWATEHAHGDGPP